MKVGESSTELVEWFQANDDQAAYITAWNPFGRKISNSENYAAEERLIAEIESRGFFYLKGESIDPKGLWVNEPSLLIFGITLESAKELVKRYHQDGFIYIGNDAKPQLVLLR